MTDEGVEGRPTYKASVGGGNPVDRLVAFLLAAEGAKPGFTAREIFQRITGTRPLDHSGFIRKHLALVLLAESCSKMAKAVKEADPIILQDSIEVFDQALDGLVNIRWDRPWEEFAGKVGPKAAARAQWLRAHYPKGLPDAQTVEGWEARLRRALREAEAVLEAVPESDRDLRWVQMVAAIHRAVEQLDTVRYAGPAAISRAIAEISPAVFPAPRHSPPAWRELLGVAADLTSVMANSSQLGAFADNPLALPLAAATVVIAGAGRRLLGQRGRGAKQLPPQASPGTGNAPGGDS